MRSEKLRPLNSKALFSEHLELAQHALISRIYPLFSLEPYMNNFRFIHVNGRTGGHRETYTADTHYGPFEISGLI